MQPMTEEATSNSETLMQKPVDYLLPSNVINEESRKLKEKLANRQRSTSRDFLSRQQRTANDLTNKQQRLKSQSKIIGIGEYVRKDESSTSRERVPPLISNTMTPLISVDAHHQVLYRQ